MRTSRSTSVVAPIWNPVWLDTQNLLGNVRHEKLFTFYDGDILRVINSQGKQRWQARLRNMGKSKDGDGEDMELYPTAVTWRCLRKNSPFLLVEQSWGMSDGRHFACYFVNYKSGERRFLRDGITLGLSPSRKLFAVADHEWVGSYKRGGQRVGALKIVSLKSGKAWAITSKLVSIGGGDWRGAK